MSKEDVTDARDSGPRDQASTAVDDVGTADSGDKVYTEAEVLDRLRGQSKELERLRAIEAEHLAAQEQRAEERRQAEEAAGNYSKLYEDERARALGLEQRLEEISQRLDAVDAEDAARVQERLAAITDEQRRAQVAELLEGRSPREQRKTLRLFLEATSTAPQPRQGGAPTVARAEPVSDQRFARDPSTRKAEVLEAVRRARGA